MKFLSWSLLICLTFLAFTSTCVTGQSRYFAIKSIKYTAEGKDFHFPIFSKDSVNNPTIEKINQHLQLSELEMLKGFQTQTIFEKVKYDNGTIYGGKQDMTYSIYTNTSKVLSLGFDESSCGATCAYWSRYYTFNSGNGDLIQLSDLFTGKGYKLFQKYVIKKSVSSFKKQLVRIGVKDSVWADVIDELGKYDIDDFRINGTSIIIDGNNCLSKNEKFSGLDMIVKLTLGEFKPYLNNYGKSIFGLNNEPIAKYKSQSLPQLFTGKIDKYPVLFILRPVDNQEYEGVYCYQKYGRGIYMKGTIVKGQIDLEEYNSRFDTKAYIIGRITRDSVVATWYKTKNSEPLKLVVYRK